MSDSVDPIILGHLFPKHDFVVLEFRTKYDEFDREGYSSGRLTYEEALPERDAFTWTNLLNHVRGQKAQLPLRHPSAPIMSGYSVSGAHIVYSSADLDRLIDYLIDIREQIHARRARLQAGTSAADVSTGTGSIPLVAAS